MQTRRTPATQDTAVLRDSNTVATTDEIIENAQHAPPPEAVSKETIKRMQISMPDGLFERLGVLQRMTEAASKVAVIRRALRIYEALVMAAADGKNIYIEDPRNPSIRDRLQLF